MNVEQLTNKIVSDVVSKLTAGGRRRRSSKKNPTARRRRSSNARKVPQGPAKPANPAALAVGRMLRNDYFFLKYPNFGFGFGFGLAGAASAAPPAAVHSCNTPASHVI